MKFLMT